MENTIILNSGQKIEVLFQDEVSLDIDCSLRYIESGKQELDSYVKNNIKPSLDQTVVQAQADMAAQIAQGVEDAAQAAAASSAEAIAASIALAESEVSAYVSENITPDLNAFLSQASQAANEASNYAQTASDKADAASASASIANTGANSAQTSAQEAAQSAQSAADSAALAIAKSSYGNIGDIKYTTRTDVPNGGAWCDGAEYTQAAFPDIYQMLVDGKISSTDYTSFADSISTNGSCGLFALDTATTSFKVPLLKDVYIKAGQTPSTFGAESLPNITGELGGLEGSAFYTSGAFSIKDTTQRSGGAAGDKDCRASFDASLSSSTYQDSAKVNPDHVVYRAYVVLYSSAAEASVAQAAEFMTALGGKANTDLSNISGNIDYIVESYQNGTEWYRIYKSGWVEQGGVIITTGDQQRAFATFLKEMADTNYFVSVTVVDEGSSNYSTAVDTRSTTSMAVFTFTEYRPCSWEIKGYGA